MKDFSFWTELTKYDICLVRHKEGEEGGTVFINYETREDGSRDFSKAILFEVSDISKHMDAVFNLKNKAKQIAKGIMPLLTDEYVAALKLGMAPNPHVTCVCTKLKDKLPYLTKSAMEAFNHALYCELLKLGRCAV